MTPVPPRGHPAGWKRVHLTLVASLRDIRGKPGARGLSGSMHALPPDIVSGQSVWDWLLYGLRLLIPVQPFKSFSALALYRGREEASRYFALRLRSVIGKVIGDRAEGENHA